MKKSYHQPEMEITRFDMSINIMENVEGNHGDGWEAGLNGSPPDTTTPEDPVIP